MTKTNIAITEHEDKTSQGGKDYTRFKTNNGWMSCFEKDVIAKCKDNEGKIVSLEIAESEKNGRTFNNIRNFYEVVSGVNEQIENTPQAPIVNPTQAFTKKQGNFQGTEETYFEPRKSVKGSAYEKDPVGLVVELCASGWEYEQALECVKQAQKAFN